MPVSQPICQCCSQTPCFLSHTQHYWLKYRQWQPQHKYFATYWTSIHTNVPTVLPKFIPVTVSVRSSSFNRPAGQHGKNAILLSQTFLWKFAYPGRSSAVQGLFRGNRRLSTAVLSQRGEKLPPFCSVEICDWILSSFVEIRSLVRERFRRVRKLICQWSKSRCQELLPLSFTVFKTTTFRCRSFWRQTCNSLRGEARESK